MEEREEEMCFDFVEDDDGCSSSMCNKEGKDCHEPPQKRKKFVNKRWKGAAVYKTKFNPSWQIKWPFLSVVKNDPHSCHCSVCNKRVSCGHQGERDILRHTETQSHKRNSKGLNNTRHLNFSSNAAAESLRKKVIQAEVKVTNLLVQHNVPLAVSDHLSPIFKEVFPDSEAARAYGCARTKTMCILNGALAPYYKSQLVTHMASSPYCIAIDGSNDTGLSKMNPMTVRLFDENTGTVVTRLLDMCLTSGAQCGTASTIFSKMEEVLSTNGITWDNCVGVAVDNTSVNVGRRNSNYSIMTRVVQENPSVYFMGCPCHVIHNTAIKASQSFSKVTHFDIEGLMIDNFFYFDKSSKRKNELHVADFCVFCDVEYRKLLKHISVRWLSLELAVERTLKLYTSLKSYFLSQDTNASDARFQRLKDVYSNPISEVYLLFYQAILPSFMQFNKLLQRNDPIISILHDQTNQFIKSLLGKFIVVRAIKGASSMSDVDYHNKSQQLQDSGLHIGLVTRQLCNRLEEEGDITQRDVRMFYNAVREFYITATDYALANLPLKDKVVKSASFVDFERKDSSVFCQVEFFIERYPLLLPYTSVAEINILQEEFLDWQLMERNEIPDNIWDSALISDGGVKHYSIDVLWSFLKRPDGTHRFPRLAKVAQLVVILPHSNAEEERVFSLINKNKTKFCSNLQLDGTLSSIVSVKLANLEPCATYEPPMSVLEKAKAATMEYNRKHSE